MPFQWNRYLTLPFIALIAFAAGCGGGGGASGHEAEHVAVAFVEAMSKLDVHRACELSFTNRRGPAYHGMTERDKKKECEVGYLNAHPLEPGGAGPNKKPKPPELGELRFLYGLKPAVTQSIKVSGNSATVIVRKAKTGERRHVRLTEEDDRWLVYEVEIGELIGP